MADFFFPDNLKPMLAKTGKIPIKPSDYGFEIKWDGLRAIIYVAQGSVRIQSRNLKNITRQYPELAALTSSCPDKKLVLDGEIIALDRDGRPSFSLLQHRMGVTAVRTIEKLRLSIPVTYIIFDILFLEPDALLNRSYSDRRSILADLSLSGPHWQTPAYWRGTGEEVLTASRTNGLEGIVAKRLDSAYQPGLRSGAWIKIKNSKRQELVIAGWVPGTGKRKEVLSSLLVGYYNISPQEAARLKQEQLLVFAGKVGTGFSDKQLLELTRTLKSLFRPSSPFTPPPQLADAIYAEPRLVGEFEFTEWTPNHTLRHPSFKGLRTDKVAREVLYEEVSRR